VQEFEPESWYNPCFPSKFISADGRHVWMFVAGNFTDPEKTHYRLHQIEVALDVADDEGAAVDGHSAAQPVATRA
jgi:hypothetical protein